MTELHINSGLSSDSTTTTAHSGLTFVTQEALPSMWTQTHCLQRALGNAGGAVGTWVAFTGTELTQLA